MHFWAKTIDIPTEEHDREDGSLNLFETHEIFVCTLRTTLRKIGCIK